MSFTGITAQTAATIIVLAFLAFFVLRGRKKGFLKVALTTFSLVIVIALSTALSQPVANLLEETAVGTKVEESVSDFIDEQILDFSNGESTEISSEDENSFLESLPLPSFIQKTLISGNTLEEYAQMQVETFEEYTAARFSDIIIRAVSYIIVMILSAVIIRLLLKAAGFVNKIPVIGGINRLLGALAGFLEGLLILWAAGLFIIAISSTSFGVRVISLIQANPVLNFIFDNNLLIVIFGMMF